MLRVKETGGGCMLSCPEHSKDGKWTKRLINITVGAERCRLRGENITESSALALLRSHLSLDHNWLCDFTDSLLVVYTLLTFLDSKWWIVSVSCCVFIKEDERVVCVWFCPLIACGFWYHWSFQSRS